MGAVPMMVSQLASGAQGIGGELFLGYWREAEEVAYFSIANKIAALLGFLLIAVNVVVAPKFAELWAKKDTEQLQAVASFSARLQLLISTPIFILMVIFAKNLLAVFGEEFVEAYGVLVVLLVANYISVLTGSVGWLLKMTGNEAVHKNVILTSMIISVVIGVILVPVFGAIGAAWMIFSGIVILNVLSWYQAKKILGVNTAKSF